MGIKSFNLYNFCDFTNGWFRYHVFIIDRNEFNTHRMFYWLETLFQKFTGKVYFTWLYSVDYWLQRIFNSSGWQPWVSGSHVWYNHIALFTIVLKVIARECRWSESIAQWLESAKVLNLFIIFISIIHSLLHFNFCFLLLYTYSLLTTVSNIFISLFKTTSLLIIILTLKFLISIESKPRRKRNVWIFLSMNRRNTLPLCSCWRPFFVDFCSV